MLIAPYRICCSFLLVAVAGAFFATSTEAEALRAPAIVAHRGLLMHSPENTLANFTACVKLRLSVELDVRRTKDGQLVCLHDDTLERTTNGRGRLSDTTLAELSQLDAGGWFDPRFSGERVPTIEQVFQSLSEQRSSHWIATIDLKGDDPLIERDTVQLAERHRVLEQAVFIGRAIDQPEVRERLRAANQNCHVATLAQTAHDLSTAIADRHSDWVYLRFIPTRDQVAQIHQAEKRAIVAGAKVSGNDTAAWDALLAAGIDAILTDYPLECSTRIRQQRAAHSTSR